MAQGEIIRMVFSHRLGILIMSIGILTFLGIFWPKVGLVGAGLAIIMTLGTLSFLVTTHPKYGCLIWAVESSVPFIDRCRKISYKRYSHFGGAIVILADSAKNVLNN